MNTYLKVFRLLVWFGILVNALFWVPAWFNPPFLIKVLGIDPEFHTIWLRNVGMLLLLVALFNAAGAWRPHAFPLHAWVVVAARLIAGLFFLEVWLFNSHNSSDRPEIFMWFFLVDTGFAVVKGTFLYLGLRRYATEHPAPRGAPAPGSFTATLEPSVEAGAEGSGR